MKAETVILSVKRAYKAKTLSALQKMVSEFNIQIK